LQEFTGARQISFASEADFRGRFPDCEAGAAHPFGNLNGMTVYVDTAIAAQDEFLFTAGRHDEIIRMRYDDFEKLVVPRLGKFTEPAEHPVAR
jgi:Ala-tRNA(Pro) deacylase